jgi:hypothetical protein
LYLWAGVPIIRYPLPIPNKFNQTSNRPILVLFRDNRYKAKNKAYKRANEPNPEGKNHRRGVLCMINSWGSFST